MVYWASARDLLPPTSNAATGDDKIFSGVWCPGSDSAFDYKKYTTWATNDTAT
jgi:hypothetical protein